MRLPQRSITSMHELSICQAALQQVLAVASSRNMKHVGRIRLRVGPLSGVEASLLLRAFPLIAAGTRCEAAIVEIEETPVIVHCKVCGSTSDALANRLLCAGCGAWQVALVSGDELMLASVEPAERQDALRERADV